MNCSTTSEIENRSFLIGNLGASIFMATYIGFYGMGLIVYFSCQFMTETKENHEDEIPRSFFSTFHYINERQIIYNQLIDKDWVKEVYRIYYSDQPIQSIIIDEKVNHCWRKYQDKIQNLKSKHAYYTTETSTPTPLLTKIVYVD